MIKGVKLPMGAMGVLVAIIAIMLLYGISVNNSLIAKQTQAEAVLGDLDAELQNRHDVIPSMVAVAQASMDFQTNLAQSYAEAREGLIQANNTYNQAMNSGDTALAMQAVSDAQRYWPTIRATAEAVPNADTSQLSELNNEIAALGRTVTNERKTYNDVVRAYNTQVRSFPSSMIADMRGFEEM